MNGHEKTQVTVNLFRDPQGGYRVSTFRLVEGSEPERIDTERDPQEGLGAVGFWIDVTVPSEANREDVLHILRDIRVEIADPRSETAQQLWADGRASITLPTANVELGGGTFATWVEYLRRFDACVNVLREVRRLRRLDIP